MGNHVEVRRTGDRDAVVPAGCTVAHSPTDVARDVAIDLSGRLPGSATTMVMDPTRCDPPNWVQVIDDGGRRIVSHMWSHDTVPVAAIVEQLYGACVRAPVHPTKLETESKLRDRLGLPALLGRPRSRGTR